MNRREFLKSLLAFGVAVAVPYNLAGAAAKSTFNIDTASDAEIDNILDTGAYDFEVDNYGTISFANFLEPARRKEAYGCSVDELQDINELLNFADSSSLNYRLQSIYERTLVAAPKDPDQGWFTWLKESPYKAKPLIYAELEKYLAETPDYSEEYEWLSDSANAQGLAYRFFQKEDWDLVDKLGIVIVEGECPGSSYFAAELRIPVVEANQRAKDLNVGYRFKVEGT